MSAGRVDPNPVVERLLSDAVPTLGDRAYDEVRRLAANYEELSQEWIRNGDNLAEAQESFDRAVVDGLQQTAHDAFWDTTWPACPRHPQHPLWFNASRGEWYCQRDGVSIAPLGELFGSLPPAT